MDMNELRLFYWSFHVFTTKGWKIYTKSSLPLVLVHRGWLGVAVQPREIPVAGSCPATFKVVGQPGGLGLPRWGSLKGPGTGLLSHPPQDSLTT